MALGSAARTWMLLMGLTLLSWLLHDMVGASAVVYALIVLTTVKVYLIEWGFMEVGRSEPGLRRFYLVWPGVIGSFFAGAAWLVASV